MISILEYEGSFAASRLNDMRAQNPEKVAKLSYQIALAAVPLHPINKFLQFPQIR